MGSISRFNLQRRLQNQSSKREEFLQGCAVRFHSAENLPDTLVISYMYTRKHGKKELFDYRLGLISTLALNIVYMMYLLGDSRKYPCIPYNEWYQYCYPIAFENSSMPTKCVLYFLQYTIFQKKKRFLEKRERILQRSFHPVNVE